MLETPRLLLRPLAAADVDELHRMWTHPAVREYLFDGEIIPRERAASIVEESGRLFAARRFGLWGARPRTPRGAAPAPLIGVAGYWFFRDPPALELLYTVVAEYWGRGLATEMARGVIDYAFDVLDFDEVRASADVPNAASVRVMEKLGMRFDRRAVVGGVETVFYRLARVALSSP